MKTGLFFGSFNPIHIGHLVIANYIIEYTDLKEIWFVVSPHNPLKAKQTLLDDRNRLYMVRLAIEDDLRFRATDIEFNLPQPSYTIDTMTFLSEKYAEREFTLIMGEDNLYTLHKWKNPVELVRRFPIITYPRLKSGKSNDAGLLEILSEARITMTEAPLMEISGTFIRKAIKEGKDISHFLPAPVWKYIKEMHYYEK
jgi:nicotinate-nucleotide adenylyltransferase